MPGRCPPTMFCLPGAVDCPSSPSLCDRLCCGRMSPTTLAKQDRSPSDAELACFPLSSSSAAVSATSSYCQPDGRSEEHTSEIQTLMRISYAVFCLTKKYISRQTRQTTFSMHSLRPTA